MKNKLGLLLISLLLLSSCNEQNIDKGELLSEIYIASDLHFLANSLVENTTKYAKRNLTRDGRIQEYDYDLLSSIIKEININEPNYFIITGDLTFNGERDSHIELIKLLKTINKNTKTLVIPGNHDINNLNSTSYANDKVSVTQNISIDDFRSFYADFGYDDAISYDSESLSYFYKLDESTYGLFLDTTLSKYNYEFDANTVGGFIQIQTMEWIENNLIKAANENKKVISFMHHNLITHHENFENLFTLNNAKELQDLFYKYDVRLNFSGHLHIQNIASITNKKKKIYDISSSSILDYGNRYGILKRYDNSIDYKACKIPLSINDISFSTFYQKFYDKSLSQYEYYYNDKSEALLDLCAKINAYYFDGDYEKIHELLKSNRKLKRFILSNNFKSTYFQVICKCENKNQHDLEIYL